jgi:hypothetical protein
MLKLRRFLCGCFGNFALVFIIVSTATVPRLFHTYLARKIWSSTPSAIHHNKPVSIFQVVLLITIFVSPLFVAFLNGMAWRTVKKGKSSARGWAIAASLSLILSSILVLVPGFFAWKYTPIEFLIGLFVIGAAMMAVGISGLVAFARRNSMAQPVIAAKPPRIAGDGTSRLLEILAFLVGIIGVYNGITWWLRWGSANGLPVDYGILYFVQIAAALLITTTVHEFGHATVGLALGMKLRSFIVGPFQWRIRDGRWKFQFLPAKFFSAGGATALVPTDPHQSRWKEVSMIAAGPLASLLAGLTAMAAALMAKGQPYEQCWELLALIATFGLVGFAMNLMPVRPESLYSDGARIYQLLRGGPWADYYRVIYLVGSTVVTPLRPRDYDIEAIKRAEQSFTKGHQALMLRLFASSYFLDRGMIPEASQEVAEAETIYHDSALDIPAELCMAFVYRIAFLRRDAASARQWWERMEAKKPTHFGVDYWLAQSALFWIEGRREEARAAWNKGNVLAQQLPVAGDCEFDRYRSALLHDCIENEAANSAS